METSKGKNIIDLEIDGDERNPKVVHRVDDQFEFKIGMLFNSEEEAYNTYNAYALNKGFGVRKGQKYFNPKHGLRRCTFLCSCEGFAPYIPPHEERKIERKEIRCGCKAHIKFKIEDDMWEVIDYSPEHNHSFIEKDQRHLIRSGRKITHTIEGVPSSMTEVSIRPTRAYSFLSNDVRGVQNDGFTLRDDQNFLQSKKANMISAGDAQNLVNHFNTLQVSDPMFFYTMQLDDQNRMTNFFWRDGMSKLDYECFGDVVIFDATYRTNKYNMIYAPFVGVNHHRKNVYFGCAFLLDETTTSFVWLFEAFLKAMGNKAPKTIFTDQDHAMTNAIGEVFPNTRHRLCEWHIEKNAAQNIPHLYGKPDFKSKYFNKLLYGCETIEEFESTWREMVAKWDLGENKWLKELYELRRKWCSTFSLDTFSANIRSTQRSDSTNNVFQHTACKTMTLTEFVNHYEKNALQMREVEVDDDFNCARGKPRIYVRKSGILNQAANVYTHTIFRMFQDEFIQGMSEHIVSTTTDGPFVLYVLTTEGCKGGHTVSYNCFDNMILCSCKLFEAKGWLCRHALHVLNNNNVLRIPMQYILKRWAQCAKQGIQMDDNDQVSQNVAKPLKIVRLNKLMRRAFGVMSLSANAEETTEIAFSNLDLTENQVRKCNNSLGMNEDVNEDAIDNDSEIPDSNSEKRVMDFPHTRAKGVQHTRVKSTLEKRRKKRTLAETSSRNTQPIDVMSSLPTPNSYHAMFDAMNQSMNPNFQHQYPPFVSFPNLTFTQMLSQGSSNSVTGLINSVQQQLHRQDSMATCSQDFQEGTSQGNQ